MKISGQFGVPPSEVPQYVGSSNNNSSRGTTTSAPNSGHGHLLINLSHEVSSNLSSPSHAHHGQSTLSSMAHDVAAAAQAPSHSHFQEQVHPQHYHFLQQQQQQSNENVQKLQEQIQQKKQAIPKQGIHQQQQTPTMVQPPPPNQTQESQHSLTAQHQLGLGLEPNEAAPPSIHSGNVTKLPSPASNFSKGALVSAGSADQINLGAALDIDQAEEGGGPGNRWPRQETLALLQIRADMDASFRDSSLKRPLWEEVSRKLGELGYERSAKKCKEKFENVNKYYRRTKEGKAGRQDGKSYRFFTQLEALSANTNSNVTPSSMLIVGNINTNHNNNIKPGAHDDAVLQGGSHSSSLQAAGDTRTTGSFLLASSAVGGTADPSSRPTFNNTEPVYRPHFAENNSGLNLSSESSSDGDYDDDDDDEYEDPRPSSDLSRPMTQSKKRKRKSSGRMMAFFEGLMKKVIDKQEQMQQKFLEALERRESDRMAREEAWKRQEMARLSREHELRAQERSSAATRDAAIITFLQKVTGQTVQLPPRSVAIAAQPVQSAPPLHHETTATMQFEDHDPFDPNSKRWPKPEVLALIKLRSGLHSKFTEAGPKGPLWEEISKDMARSGYANRSAKRCKEKWENINKYFKKAKESNKKRPENAKTCPYFHELDALYRKGVLGGLPMVTSSNVKQLPYKPTIDDAYQDDENLLHQPSTSNTEGNGGDGQGHDSEMLAITPSGQGTGSDATASTNNLNAGGSNNKSSKMVTTHLFSGNSNENGGLSKGNMKPSMDSSQGGGSTYDGLNLDSKGSNARIGSTPDLGLQLQQQSSMDLQQHNQKMNAVEQQITPQN